MTEDLETFHCSRDYDVESFLRENAISFERRHLSRTYLLVDPSKESEKEPAILAYFSLAISAMCVGDAVSKTMRRRLCVNPMSSIMASYVIGQLGKNDRYANETRGGDILEIAVTYILEAHQVVGGRFVRVDCRDNAKIKRFYERNGFTFVQKNPNGDLCQYVRFLDPK